MQRQTFAEIEIRGSLLPVAVEPGTTACGGRVKYDRVVVECDVVRAIDAAGRDGVRVLLVIIDSPGGILRSGLAVFSRLRAFADAGGLVLAYVLKAKSTAPLVAEAADFVAMDPDGTMCLHGALADGPGYDLQADNSAVASIMAARTGMPIQRLAPFCVESDFMAQAHAAGSVRLGLADAIATLESMRGWAARAAAEGRLPPTPWSRRRPGLVAPVTASSDAVGHDVQSSESDYSLPNPGWGSPAPQGAVDDLAALVGAIASDNKLTSAEKGPTLLAYHDLVDNQPVFEAQAESYVPSVSHVSYTAAINALRTYFTGTVASGGLGLGSDYATESAWRVVTQDIVGTTFRGKFNDAYAARAALLNAFAERNRTTSTNPGGANLVRNSSFEIDDDANGIADGFEIYNNSPVGEPATASRVSDGLYGGYAQRITWSVNAADTKGIRSNSGVTVRGKPGGLIGGWRQGVWYVLSVWARASGTNVGKYLGLAWNTGPDDLDVLACPPLTSSFQRYVFRIRFTSVAPSNEWFLTISNVATRYWIATGTQGTLDFDALQIEEGQAPTAYAPAADDAQVDATNAQVLAGTGNAVFHSAAAPTTRGNGIALKAGDAWFNTDTTTACPDANCKGHAADAAGAPLVGGYPHRGLYWAHRWSGTAWVSAETQALVIASELAAGSVTVDKFSGNVIKTPNYTFTGTEGGANEVATAGAKMQSAPGGLALVAAVDGVKFGNTKFSDLWSWGTKKLSLGTTPTADALYAYYLLTGAAESNSLLRGCVTNGSQIGRFKITSPGNYLVSYRAQVSRGTATNGHVLASVYRIRGNALIQQTYIYCTGTNYHTASDQALILAADTAANDEFELCLTGYSATAQGQFQFTIQRLPE